MENFNLFKNLHLTEDGHTSILKRILHPRGTHGCGDVFLKIFLNNIDIEYNDKKTWYVNSKKSGNRGLVDLIIFNDDLSTVVVIENKIRNAPDQEYQLYRYWRNEIYEPLFNTGKYSKEDLISQDINNVEEIKKHFKIIYLTKDGNKKPSILSLSKPKSSNVKYSGFPEILNFNYTNLTYKDGIKNWLIECQKFVLNEKDLNNKTFIRLLLFLEQYIEWI